MRVEAVHGLKSAGVDVILYGKNSHETDRRAPYDFFCVYRVPSAEFQREFERQITTSGWYNYFEQMNIGGPVEDFAAVLLGNAKMVRPG
jgi:haloalkane dehalogenase